MCWSTVWIDVAGDPNACAAASACCPTRGVYKRLTARENITYFGELHGLSAATIAERTARLSAALQMDDFLDRATEGFSQGQRTKTAIARALIHDPRNVIPRRTHQRPRRDDHPRPARLPARAARRRPLRDLSSHIMQGGRRAVRSHRDHRPGGCPPRAHRRTAHAGRRRQPRTRFVKLIGSDEGLHA